jgi:hypothetical protein
VVLPEPEKPAKPITFIFTRCEGGNGWNATLLIK